MKYGVRQIADVVLRAKSKQKVGKRTFYRNDPIIYFDSLTTSSLEGAATTNYATGGDGNARLMAWEGERTLTFNMTDALISPESFMILAGAGLVDGVLRQYPQLKSRVPAGLGYEILDPSVSLSLFFLCVKLGPQS